MFGNTMSFIIDSPINAMAVSRDGTQLAVAGRSLLKVYSLENKPSSFGSELFNLRSSNLKNLNFSNSDVTWCPLDDGILATAATNGAVVVWNLMHSAKSKIEVVFNDHKRTVNKVCFHSNDSNFLLSGSQDGCMKLFDLRKKESVATFVSNSESVRDVQFSPFSYSTNHFASVQETGYVEIWDIRRTDKPECSFIAHDGPVFACEWHPNQEQYKWLATGGRDKTIKVWDLTNRSKPQLIYNVHTIAPVSKLKWRPNKSFHIGSCSLVVDFSVYVWDIKRPYVPYAIFGTRKDVTTGFAWKNDPFVFISSCKDGTVYQHRFETDAYYPAEHYPPIGIDLNPRGDVAFSMTDFIHRYSQTLNNPSLIQQVDNETTSQSGRLIKTHSLGTNSIMTTSGIMSGINISNFNNFHQNQTQPYSLSTSLTQNNWENPLTTHPVTDMKRLSSMSTVTNQYFQNSLQSQSHYQNTINNLHLMQMYSPPNYQTTFLSTGYNISVPVSYKNTPEVVLAEHFRCMVSYMMFFLSKDMTELNVGLQNDISMKQFINSAKLYLLSDRPFEELCEYNAQVSDSLNRHQIAQTWRIVRHMFSIAGRHPTSSGGAGNNPSGGSISNMPPIGETHIIPSGVDMKLKSDNPSRHTSGGTRHFSGNNPVNSVPNSANNPNSTANTSFIFKDSCDEDDKNEICDGLPNHFTPLKQNVIPNNNFAQDFFDYSPNNIDQSIDFPAIPNLMAEDNFVDLDINELNFPLRQGSFCPRPFIPEHAIQINEFNPNNAGEALNYDVNSPVSNDEDEELCQNSDDTQGHFDINIQSLAYFKNHTLPSPWPFTQLVADMLRYYVDNGDVQTTISIIMVLGDKMKQVSSIDKRTINIWFRAYIDLLHRFQLWNVSTRLIQLNSDTEIQGINQSSTSVLVYCAKCNKAIKHGSIQCEKCRMEPSNCSICHVSVRGMYTWCQGCAHGGHLQHMLEWFKSNSLCPAGCGHQCELC